MSKILVNIDSSIFISAFRYALGRKSYITRLTADEIKNNVGLLSERDRELIYNEIEDAISSGSAGMDCDVEIWRGLQEALDA